MSWKEVLVIGVEQLDLLSNFDLMVRFLIPFGADALYEKYNIADTEIYEHDWPILSLEASEHSYGFLEG